MTRLAFLGDVVPGGVLALDMEKKAADRQVLSYLKNFDFVVANLEAPFGIPEWQVDDKPIIFARPQDAVRLRELNISLVSLANNHVFDLGIKGFKNTLDILDEMGIAYCGAGMNLEQARKPAFVEINGIKLGFLGYCRDIRGVPLATEDTPGVAFLEESQMLEDIASAKQECDYLYILLHWNAEYTWLPYPESPAMMRKLINAGASGVIGGHSHRIQSYGSYKGKPYYYSLGNFLFPDYIIGPPRTMYYPDETEKIDLDALPMMATNKPADKLYFREWRKYSRVGILGEVTIRDGIQSCKARFTVSQRKDSRLRFLSPPKSLIMDLWLKLIAIPINSFIYRVACSLLLFTVRQIRKVITNE